MKKEGVIDFAARGRALKDRRTAEQEADGAKPPAQIPPPPSTSEEPEGSLVHLEIPRAPLRVAPPPDRFEVPSAFPTAAPESEQSGSARSGLNLRMLSRLDLGDRGLGLNAPDLVGRDFLGLVRSPEDQTKLSRLTVIETALRGLPVRQANVGIRRNLFRTLGMDDLTEMFWTSVESYWAAQPAMYVALLDELEERGYFNIANVPPPPPTPPAAPTGRQPRRDKKRRR